MRLITLELSHSPVGHHSACPSTWWVGNTGLVGGVERRSYASRKTKKTPYGDFVFDVKCGIASGLTCFMYNTFSLKPSRRAGKSIAFQFVVSGKEKYAMFKGYRTTKK